MKRILTILSLLTATTLAHGQGRVVFNNLSATFSMFTNRILNIDGTPSGSGTRGATATTPNRFHYALLTADYTGSLTTTNPLDPAFTFTGLLGTNSTILAGGVQGAGGVGGTSVPGWGEPTGGTYDTAERSYYLIVGWSINLGSSWAQIQARIANNFAVHDWSGDAYYGVSQLGNGYSGGGPLDLPAATLFGVSAAMPGGITSGFDMNLVLTIPEPATFTLAGLGAAALLIFRRRK